MASSDPSGADGAGGGSAPRVFLGLSEVAGYYGGLTRGLREIGFDADLVTLDAHPFAYEGVASQAARRAEGSVRRLVSLARGFRPLALVLEGIGRVALLVWAIRRYDVFVFGFRNTFLIGWDLPILRLFRKDVVCVFHGSDHRPPYLDGVVSAGRTPDDLRRRSARVERLVRRIERWTLATVGNPLSAQFHRRPVAIFQVVGTPVAPPAEARQRRGAEPDASNVGGHRSDIVIVHAPSMPAAKGSPRIRAALEQLRGEGYSFEYVELVGRPNDEVLAELDRCTFVIDQLYSDTTLAGFATEAAAFGKPAVVGGYGLDHLRRALPADAVPPAFYCEPDDLVDTVRAVLDAPDHGAHIGRAAQAFVEEQWNRTAVAHRFARLLDGDTPGDWWFDPSTSTYLHGCCLSDGDGRRIGSALVASFGPSSLRLADKPELLRMALERFAPGGSR